MERLASKKCVPCEGGIPPLPDEKLQEFLSQVESWTLEEKDGHKQIVKEFKFKNFKEAMNFVNRVAEIAEAEGHHPNISINYNKVKLENYTHAVGGLHDNDFILAAKIDRRLKQETK